MASKKEQQTSQGTQKAQKARGPKSPNLKLLAVGLLLFTAIPLSVLFLAKNRSAPQLPTSASTAVSSSVSVESRDSSPELKQDVKSGSGTGSQADSAAARLAAQAAALNQAHSGAASISNPSGTPSKTSESVQAQAIGAATGNSRPNGLSIAGAPAISSPSLPSAGTGSTQANASAQKSQATPLTKEAAAPVIQQGCFEITFKHKKMSSHSDGEACLKHQNLITLKHPELNLATVINPESVCIEVNGEVVKHQLVSGHADQILIGPYAGPNATITARACTSKTCQKKCIAKKDSFMSALGLGEGAMPEGESHVVGWNGSTQEGVEEAELAKEVKDVRHIVAGESLQGRNGIFDSWIAEKFRASSCSKGVDHENHAKQETKLKVVQVSQRDK